MSFGFLAFTCSMDSARLSPVSVMSSQAARFPCHVEVQFLNELSLVVGLRGDAQVLDLMENGSCTRGCRTASAPGPPSARQAYNNVGLVP